MSNLDQAELNRLHDRAMDLASRAKAASNDSKPDTILADALWNAAFDHERRVADRLLTHFELEPSRGIIYRSAAALALRCDELVLAERYAAQGLAGNVDDQIAEQLREVFDEVRFRRHTTGLIRQLRDETMHVSMTGRRVTPDFIDAAILTSHIENLHRIIVRVQELLLGYQFRRSGRISKGIQDTMQVRYEPASNRVFGYDLDVFVQQPRLKFVEEDEGTVIGVTRRIFDLAQAGNRSALLSLCQENRSYYRYFTNAARDVMPDGKRLAFVGLQSSEYREAVTLRPADRRTVLQRMGLKEAGEKQVTIEGRLKGTQGSTHSDELIVTVYTGDDEKIPQRCVVPEGLSGERIGQLWDSRVRVRGFRKEQDSLVRVEFIRELTDEPTNVSG